MFADEGAVSVSSTYTKVGGVYDMGFRHDPDHPLAAGEVGKVGVPVVHKGHMRTLLDGIPTGEMNTSMTINAPAAWLLGLY
ncbi:MAG: methylmalonyl-CoA mutase family protein, partial [Acidimicrobiales bacterium]